MANTDLNLAQKQTTALNPAQIQALSVLQMDISALEDYLAKKMEENPVIEERDDVPAVYEPRVEPRRARVSGDTELSALDFAAAPDERDTLAAFLKDQLERKRLPDWQLRLAVFAAGLLDERGYLPEEDRRYLRERLPYSGAIIDRTIALLQSLDPPGVAARDLKECLLLQLERSEQESALAEEIVRAHLESLAGRHYSAIARKLRCPVEKVAEAAAQIRALSPRPGSAFGRAESVPYIRPDVYIEEETGEGRQGLRIVINRGRLDRYCVSPEYRAMAEETDSAEAADYLRTHIRDAERLMAAVADRTSTLESCVRILLRVQRPFFEEGRGSLQPLTLTALAQELGVHESTVSRALRDKYLMFRNRVYPFSFFFSRSLSTHADAEMSAADIKAWLRRRIEAEDLAQPLSDEQLREALQKELGAAVTRRTVAKYRTAMGIPPLSERKRA